MDIIITKRLTLRPPLEVDAEDLQKALSNPQVARNLSAVPQPYTLADAHEWIADNAATQGKCVYTIHRERLIGAIGVHAPSRTNNQAMLGYWLDEPHWGQGYITEAARAVLSRAFATMSVDEIGCRSIEDNIGSIKVMEKLGFKVTGESEFSSDLRGDGHKAINQTISRETFEKLYGSLDQKSAA